MATRFQRLVAILSGVVLCASIAAAATASKSTKTASKASVSSSTKKTGKKVRRTSKRRSSRRGQKAIQSDRARQIQEALIREKYLSGEANGVWDERSKAAMRRYQEDNGWQTKVLPDSRALIKLGLGPDQSALLNPDTAATHMQPETVLGGGTNQQ